MAETGTIEASEGFIFVDKIANGIVPKFITSVAKGVETNEQWVMGYQFWISKLHFIYDGSYHEVDSVRWRFTIAASMAFRTGALNATSFAWAYDESW